ncbi:MAG TPA: TonB-dependent receptor [Chitinophagaceae bacterium]
MKSALLKVWLLIACFLIVAAAWSQGKRISGKVLSADDNQPLPGVSVVVKGKTSGTQTNATGDYALEASEGDVLVFSFTGYQATEVPIGTGNTVNLTLKVEDQSMDEVVVVGYGTQKRSKITGSVSKLDNKVLEAGVRSNPASALAGTIPGLRVQQTSGRPGAMPSIILRGGTNYNGSGSPLVVVDGLVRDGLHDINSEDIESIEVLKDASATAIYGARANNGVILVTTKKGKRGVSHISVKAKTGINTLNIPYDFLNARDYIYWSRTAIKTSGQYEPSRLSQLTATGPFGTGNRFRDANGNILDGNVNSNAVWSTMILGNENRHKLAEGWQTMIDPVNGDTLIFKDFQYRDYALRDNSLTQDYNVSMTGGNDNGSYYAGIGLYDEKGMPINTFYKRLTFILNGEYKIRPWLTSTSSFNFADARWRDPVTNTEGRYLARSLGAPPTMRGFNEKGEMLVGRDWQDGNPAVNDHKFIRKNRSDKFTLSQAFQVNFLRNLWLRTSGNWYYDEGHNESFDRDFLQSPGSINTTRSTSANFDRILRQTYNAVLNYNAKLFRKSTLDLMGGSEFYDVYSQGLSASGNGAPTDDFMDLGLTNSDKDRRGVNSYHERQRILSFFSRATYDYDGKYLLTATFRRDGYSRLLNNRWGNFPGISVGWNVHREDFFEPLSGIFNAMKLRASYGQNGNVSGIGAYSLQGSYGSSRYNGSTGFRLGGLPFPDLLWERSSTYEVGLETRLLNRIDFNIAYYNRKTSDKISSFNLPATAGITSLTTNNGSMQNQGVEMDANYRILRGKDLQVDFSANAAYNVNKILKLPANGLPNNRQGGLQIYDSKSGQVIWVGGFQEGQDPNVAYAYVADGLYRTADELNKLSGVYKDLNGARILVSPAAYATMTAAEKGKVFPIALGDVRWKDVDNNDTIDFRDRQYMGRTVPRWTGGFSPVVRWKGFTLSSRFDFALGFVQYDGPRAWFLSNAQGTFNTTTEVFDTWTPENTNAKYPTYYWADQLYKNNTFRESSMFYKKGDYLAFREVHLAYSLPKHLASKIGSQGVNVSVTGQNLTYFSQSTLHSPESGSIAIGGAGEAGYPLPRTVIFGLQFLF